MSRPAAVRADARTESVAEQVFVALADPTRRAILADLAARGPATATDLALRVPITRQAIAKHLALLRSAGLVVGEPAERRRVRYRVRPAPVRVAQQFLAMLSRDWDERLDEPTRLLERPGKGGVRSADRAHATAPRRSSR